MKKKIAPKCTEKNAHGVQCKLKFGHKESHWFSNIPPVRFSFLNIYR